MVLYITYTSDADLLNTSLQKMATLHQSKIIKYGKPALKGQLNIEGWNSTAPQSAQTALQLFEQTVIKYYATLKSF